MEKCPFEIIGKEEGIEKILQKMCEISKFNRQSVDFLVYHPEEMNHFVYNPLKNLEFPKYKESDYINKNLLGKKGS